jgi:hypothetical protein
MHDPTKVLLGTTGSSAKDSIQNFDADPADFPAGTAVRLKSDGSLSKEVGDGSLIGVSLGKSLSNDGRTAVLRAGDAVPIRLTADFVPTPGDLVWIDDVTGLAQAEDDGDEISSKVTSAVYVSGALTGVQHGTTVTVSAALVDMGGGL